MVAGVSDIISTIGNTPLLEIEGILAKLETTNPTGSIKDRMAWYMVQKAEERGELLPGSKIIEVTSGNTGIAFAMISAVKGYKFTAVMPESMSIERIRMMKAYGTELVLTPAKEDMAGAVRKYEELVKNNPEAWLPRQFENPDNIASHEQGIGRELALQTAGKIGAFAAGIGTGGTLIGVARALKKINPEIKIIGVEPAESAVLSGQEPGTHLIQGIGEGFIPQILKDNLGLIDEIIKIGSRDAINESRRLALKHGLLVGISSGANMLAALQAKKKYGRVATLFPDRGERYLSCR